MSTASTGAPDPETPSADAVARTTGDAAAPGQRVGDEAATTQGGAAEMPPSFPPAQAPRQAEPGVRRGGWLRETAIVMVSALVLSVLIKSFLAQAFFIPSGSMEDTLAVGDRVMVNKLVPGPFELERGDIVVFVDPGGWLSPTAEDARPAWQQTLTDVFTWIGLLPQDAGHHLIKRVIGLGGDRVTCCTDDGLLTVNGEPVTEPYLKPGTVPSEVPFDVVVPEGHVWVMGDNRSNSEDSRAHLGDPGGGMVPVDNIVGRAFVLLWPADRISLLDGGEESFATVPETAP